MNLYRLHIAPDEDSDDANWDRWFSTLRRAKKVRGEIITDNPCLEGSNRRFDLEIERVHIPAMSPKKLAIMLLNGEVPEGDTVVDAYWAAHEENEETGCCELCGAIVSLIRYERYKGIGPFSGTKPGKQARHPHDPDPDEDDGAKD
jgi:hypothetical protein